MGGQNSGRGGLPPAMQQRIVRLIQTGKRNVEIARELGINVSTVSRRKTKIRRGESTFVGRISQNDVLDHAITVARSIRYVQETCAIAKPLNAWLERIFADADLLRNGLTALSLCLQNAALRRRLSNVHSDAVSLVGAVGPSYVEVIFVAGERLYVAIYMLCRHGVLFPFKSRLHPSQARQINEPWPRLPVPQHIVYDGSHGGCLRSPKHLLARICDEVRVYPAVNEDDTWHYLLKETVAARALRRVAAVGQDTTSRKLKA